MKATKIVTILLSFFIVLGTIAVFVPAEYFVLERKWTIQWGQKATRLKLKKYEFIGRPNELRSWLLQVDGAPGQEAAVLFLSWGIDNQDDFEVILDGIDSEQKPAIVNLLAGMIVERGMEQNFRDSFSDTNSTVVHEIFVEVDRIKNVSRS